MPKFLINNTTKAIIIFSIAFVLFYSITYITINSYEINGQRYFCLFDDAMISMRYAENIANGYGPQWNTTGEKVEGFSNPLWVYIMAIVHLLPISKAYTSLVIQLIAIILLILNLILIKKITENLTKDSKIINLSILLTAVYLPLLNWSLQGLEITIIVVLLNLYTLKIIEFLKNNNKSFLIFLLPALLLLIRMDAILFSISFILITFFFNKEKLHKLNTPTIFSLLSSLTILIIWRYAYYHEILPNTYYLKMTGYPIIHRLIKGLYSFIKFSLFLTPFFLVLPFWHYLKNKNLEILILITPLFVMSVYTIYIGGDSWEWWIPSNRFLSATIPLFIIAALISINNYFKNYYYTFSIIFLLTLNFNNWEYLKAELLLEKTFTEKDNRKHTYLALESKKIITPQGTAAVTIAGTLPYFLERNCIDILGKNDKAIARMKVLNNNTPLKYNPGHMKWNYSYSIGKLQPDAVLQLWEKPNEAIPYLQDYEAYNIAGFNVFFLKNSPNIDWDDLKKSHFP